MILTSMIDSSDYIVNIYIEHQMHQQKNERDGSFSFSVLGSVESFSKYSRKPDILGGRTEPWKPPSEVCLITDRAAVVSS